MKKTSLHSSDFKSGLLAPNHPVSSLSATELDASAREWFYDQEARGHSPRTIALRKILVGNLQWFLRDQNYEACGTPELRAFFAYLVRPIEDGKGRWGNARLTKPMRPATAATYHSHLRAFFHWMVNEEALDISPLEKIKPPIARADQIQPFSPEEMEALLAAAKRSRHPARDQAILLMGVDSGLMASELCSLKRRDVDFDEKYCEAVGKGNKRRKVYFGIRVRKALIGYVNAERHDPDDPLFFVDRGTRVGEGLTRGGLLQLMWRLGEEAGIRSKRCSPHTLRHTFAIEFLKAGGNMCALMELLGHTDVTMTRRYVSFAQADIQNQHRRFSPADRIGRQRDS